MTKFVVQRSEFHRSKGGEEKIMYLVQVDNRLPGVSLLLVEVAHTNLTEVTGVVLFADC